jgi:spermidine/putrescine-binding protein
MRRDRAFGLVDAGVTWKSEALFQEEIGNPIGHVDIPEAQNTRAEYSATMVKDAPHPEAARAWLDFIAEPLRHEAKDVLVRDPRVRRPRQAIIADFRHALFDLRQANGGGKLMRRQAILYQSR